MDNVMRTVTFDKDFGDSDRIDPEAKRLWLEALRSGAYTQGKGVLLDRFGYCCLGVLCDIHGKHQSPPVRFRNFDTAHSYYPSGPKETDGGHGVLPPEWVYKWAKISDKPHNLIATITSASGETFQTTVVNAAALLPALNDTYRYSFAEIANYIEQYL